VASFETASALIQNLERGHSATTEAIFGPVWGTCLRHIRGPAVRHASFWRPIHARAFRNFLARLIVTCYALVTKFWKSGFKCGWLLLRASRQGERKNRKYDQSVPEIHARLSLSS
jgi:hypothetical protein